MPKERQKIMNRTGLTSALITGSSRGLGLDIAKYLLSKGIIVHLHGNDKRKLMLTAKLLGCKYVSCDLRNPQKSSSILARYAIDNKINIFINNAGIKNKNIDEVISINLLSPIYLVQKIYDYLKKKKKGIIVSINSLAGLSGNFNEAIYCASKFGMRGFMQSLQERCLEDNIKIYEFYFGAIKTDMTKDRSDYEKLIDPKEAAKLVCDSILNYTTLYQKSQVIKRTDIL